jgi:hypothetical protein
VKVVTTFQRHSDLCRSSKILSFFCELEEEGNFDLKPEHLLSFMALRTNFNRNKIESIVESLMSKLDVQSFEFDLVRKIVKVVTTFQRHSDLCRSSKILSFFCDKSNDLYQIKFK